MSCQAGSHGECVNVYYRRQEVNTIGSMRLLNHILERQVRRKKKYSGKERWHTCSQVAGTQEAEAEIKTWLKPAWAILVLLLLF